MSAGGMRPRLVAVWVVLLALVATIVVVERRELFGTDEDEGEREYRARMLIPVPISELGVIEIADGGTLYRFERDAAGSWFFHAHGVNKGTQSMHAHQADPAQAKEIEKAFAGLGRARKERFLAFEAGKDPYSVTRPGMVILAYGKGETKPLGQYAVGDVAPDGLSRYVLPLGSPSVVTIANFQIDNLRGLIAAVTTSAGSTQTAKGQP